ncbi:MAG: DUF5915 domain-containing protein, partial [Sciscionella sp.]
VWQHAITPGDTTAEDSVHLARWPEPDTTRADEELRADMDITRQLVEIGRSARKTANVRIRQPLQRALVGIPGGRELPAELVAEIADELNVREVTGLAHAGEVVDVTVKPNFRALGKRFGSRTQQAAKAITAAEASELARVLKSDAHAAIDVAGEQAMISLDEVTLHEVPRSGWAINTHQDMTVALDTTITPDLRKAGLAREVIRLVQTARKDAGFEVTDRIVLSWAATGETADAVREYTNELADAVLAVEIVEYPHPDLPANAQASDTGVREDADLGVRFWLVRAGDRTT